MEKNIRALVVVLAVALGCSPSCPPGTYARHASATTGSSVDVHTTPPGGTGSLDTKTEWECAVVSCPDGQKMTLMVADGVTTLECKPPKVKP